MLWLGLLALLLASCGGSVALSPTPDIRLDVALKKLDELTEAVQALREELVSGSTATAIATASIPGTTPVGVPTSTPRATPLRPSPSPTPNLSNSDWVDQRLAAVIQIYNLTDQGISLLSSLDIRQMEGEPGFFGSFGFEEWAGVGEAKPIGVIHEIGHSYWGGFPIPGSPELTWSRQWGEEVSSAMRRYHSDILAFMAQPPDDFEVFRQRLRNLPALSDENREPLFHNLEADMVYGTGGSLALVPPILRKYWSSFLNDGPFASWYEATSWFRSLSNDQRLVANKFLGFEHLDLRDYDAVADFDGDAALIESRTETLAIEEQQRLFDFASQFDLLLGEAQKDEKFQFWRGYLKDKVKLQGIHEGYMASLDLPRAPELASALKFMTELEGMPPDEQSRLMGGRLAIEPFMVNFLPALDNRALQELFSSGLSLPEGTTLQAAASFVERLELFSALVNAVLVTSRDDPRKGASEIEAFLSDTGFEQKEDLRLFFELFREKDPETAKQVVNALDKETIRRLMDPVPAQLRFALDPNELLAKLDVTTDAQLSDLKRGVSLLIDESSGNFAIDRPFLAEMYGVLADRHSSSSGDMLEVLSETPIALEGFIQEEPQAAAALLGSDLGTAVVLILDSDPVVSPSARIIYRLINADPELAARLVGTLQEAGEQVLVIESLAYLAYDENRLDTVPSLPISLEQDGRFFGVLVEVLGEPPLARALSESFRLYSDRAAAGEVAADFLERYVATLEAAAATISDPEQREAILLVVQLIISDGVRE